MPIKCFVTYLILVNAAGFTLMLIDKRKARKGAWRIPEKTLMGVALLGGSLGAILGMNLLRHKTKHPKFFIGLPVILALQTVLGLIAVLKL